ncbi:uncharacterized protein A4U43_C03F30740, partial [Asparagus officinalis]
MKSTLEMKLNVSSTKSPSGNESGLKLDTFKADFDFNQQTLDFSSRERKSMQRERATANARTRLMRLSEAAESLQKRAANSVLVGKETEARELLVEKKKLMQALEKSKNRIDVLDKLAIKINE